MNKKFKLLLIINVSLFALIFVGAEVISLMSYRMRYAELINFQSKTSENPQEFIKTNTPHYIFPKKFNYQRITEGLNTRVYKSENSKKRPIVTIGCSYTEGVGLKDNQTFAYKLNQITGRTTYNRGVGGSGPQLVYRQLSDENFKNEIPDAEYVIYTFLYGHIDRQFNSLLTYFSSDIELNYILKDGILIEKERPFWFMYWSFLVKTYLEYQTQILSLYEYKNGFPLFYATMAASVEEMHKKYPNSKFVFIEFPEPSFWSNNSPESIRVLTNAEIKKLQELGIIYIKASDLLGHNCSESKYRVTDKDHPSELVWDEFVPKLVKKLEL